MGFASWHDVDVGFPSCGCGIGPVFGVGKAKSGVGVGIGGGTMQLTTWGSMLGVGRKVSGIAGVGSDEVSGGARRGSDEVSGGTGLGSDGGLYGTLMKDGWERVRFHLQPRAGICVVLLMFVGGPYDWGVGIQSMAEGNRENGGYEWVRC